MKDEVLTTPVFDELVAAKTKIRVLEGGSRSSKTWSIILWIIKYIIEHPYENKKITIARAKMTWAKTTVLEDFFEICNLYDIPLIPYPNPNRAEQSYTIYGNNIRFVGLDEPQKLHGKKQNVVWINEAMETDVDSYDQLRIRTSEFIILDYNPSAMKHWIYEKVIPREDCTFMHSTMLMNTFLDPEIRKEILSFEPTEYNIEHGTADENKWKIYGLGQRAKVEGLIFKSYNLVKEFPKPQECKWIVYGLDYGYSNDPTALVKVALHGGQLYLEEMIYSRGLTNLPPIVGNGFDMQHEENLHYLFQKLVNKSDMIIGESAEPKSNKELRSAGWNVRDAIKGPDSIKNGIDIMQRYKINIVESSLNVIREFDNYTYAKDRTGEWLNKPVDNYNHAIDAVRYVMLIKGANPEKLKFRA